MNRKNTEPFTTNLTRDVEGPFIKKGAVTYRPTVDLRSKGFGHTVFCAPTEDGNLTVRDNGVETTWVPSGAPGRRVRRSSSSSPSSGPGATSRTG